ncbi:MAG: hypothetical protein AAF821_16625 [Cyanobacteria bacterium P01_D01_bin.156]
MGLPVVLDVALGLIFVYMALGLIASEVQEIISTLLQWRAEHLKYSIEQLLSGGQVDEWKSARNLADTLYKSPMLRDLNYEAQGLIARSARQIIHSVGRIYRLLTRTRNVFGGQTSGPSYIPSEAFATTLLETLELEGLQQSVVEGRLKRLLHEQIMLPLGDTLHTLRASLGDGALLDIELRNLESSLEGLILDYRAKRTDLNQVAERVLAELEHFTDQGTNVLPESYGATQAFTRRMGYLRSQIAGGMNASAGLVRQIQPSVQELLAITLETSAGDSRRNEVTYLRQSLNGQMPFRLRESLGMLAERVSRHTNETENQLKQFQSEVESWYDRGMDRASGVYKRNAKIVGILIGFAIAAIVNADTFYIANRLTVDEAVRASVIQTLDQVSLRDIEASIDDDSLGENLQSLGDAVQSTLSDYALPIGRSPRLRATQAVLEADWRFPIPRYVFGWLVTGVAISMGSSFWFDALRRVTSVRTSGIKPLSSTASTNSQ